MLPMHKSSNRILNLAQFLKKQKKTKHTAVIFNTTVFRFGKYIIKGSSVALY